LPLRAIRTLRAIARVTRDTPDELASENLDGSLSACAALR
jgi:hypothetical protein